MIAPAGGSRWWRPEAAAAAVERITVEPRVAALVVAVGAWLALARWPVRGAALTEVKRRQGRKMLNTTRDMLAIVDGSSSPFHAAT